MANEESDALDALEKEAKEYDKVTVLRCRCFMTDSRSRTLR